MQSLENAVMVLTTVFKDDKAKSTKKAKLLISTAAKAGVALEFEKPGPGAVRDFLAARAQALGTRLAPGAADAMVQRCGTDHSVSSQVHSSAHSGVPAKAAICSRLGCTFCGKRRLHSIHYASCSSSTAVHRALNSS